MLPSIRLIAFGLRQVIGVAGPVIALVEKHYSDHSQTLPKALAKANDHAWQAVGIALAGDGFLDQIKLFFASGDDKGIREQVRLFLQDKSVGFEGSPADIRKKCLAELNLAKKAGLLSAQNLAPNDVARQTAGFERYADLKGMVDGAGRVIAEIADDLTAKAPNLGRLLRQSPSGCPPLLVSAFSFFFRREVETNQELAHGLFFDGLRQLSASQDKAFGEVGKALASLGDQFDDVFEQLDRIEDAIRRLEQKVENLVSQAGMQKGEVKPHHSFSIRSEDERAAVKQLLAEFRQLPLHRQKQVPALLNGLGKLQFGSQDFDGARQTFEAVAEEVHDAAAQAEAHFNAYRAALEEKNWDGALAAIQKAALLDAQRFAPFPMRRYQVKEILGAGGFGTAFRCLDVNFDEEVVVKTLHDGAMERNMADVFREARLLRKLNHPAIIGVHECEFADTLKHARPYLVMDYFPGGSLESHIQQDGALPTDDLLVVARQIAQGMQAAHQQGILHRDIKPDNVLVRKEGDGWKVKIIDFGLALRKQTIETSMAARSAGNTILGDSVAGTVKYAPPEQMGEMRGVKPGPYSDVYSFGKMCCYALFKTTEPRRRQWAEISEDLAEMLEGCIEQGLENRLPNFEPVLKVLEALDPMQTRERKQAEAREKAELERKHREQGEAEEAERQRQELEQLQKQGESKLIQLVREALDRTQGKPTKDDSTAANEICQQHRLPTERAKQIVGDVKAQWQKAHPPKSARKTEEITNSLGMKFAWIPPGTFLMGSPPNEEDRGAGETQHKVTLSKGFYMGVHLVTQEQWQAVMGTNPSKFKGEKNLPVEQVSWEDCQEFVKKLREKDKKSYRLPSEAEWEYACRAGTRTAYYFGDDKSMLGQYAWYDENSGSKTHPVGQRKANEWGLFDMHGNVLEWCQDWLGDYPQNDVVDPQGPNAGQYRVLRGGSRGHPPLFCRSAFRHWFVPGLRSGLFGCRLCFCLD